MARIVLRNRQLIIDGQDVSLCTAAGSVGLTIDEAGLAHLTLRFITDDFEAEVDGEAPGLPLNAQAADDGDLQETGYDALKKERQARKAAERDVAELRAKLQQYESDGSRTRLDVRRAVRSGDSLGGASGAPRGL